MILYVLYPSLASYLNVFHIYILFHMYLNPHKYSNYNSCQIVCCVHSSFRKVKDRWSHSQLLRVKRICAYDTDLETNSQNIVENYRHRGYPATTLQTSLDKVKHIQRSDLFTIDEEKEGQQKLVCITTYHPQNTPIKDILKQNWPTLLIDPKLKCVYDQTPVFGHRTPKNLRKLLVCSKLIYPPTEPKSKGGINPSEVCHNQNCRYCPKLDYSSLIKSITTGRTFIVPSKITCKFNNLIYLIICKKCQSQYVDKL